MSTNCFPHASQTWIWVLVFWFEELFILGLPNLALAKVAGVASPFQGVPDLVVSHCHVNNLSIVSRILNLTFSTNVPDQLSFTGVLELASGIKLPC